MAFPHDRYYEWLNQTQLRLFLKGFSGAEFIPGRCLLKDGLYFIFTLICKHLSPWTFLDFQWKRYFPFLLCSLYVIFTVLLILFEKSMSPEKGFCLEIIMQHFFKPIFICKDLFPKQIFHFKSFTSALQVWNHQQFVLPHKSWTQSWFILLIIKQGIFIIDRSPLNFLKFLYRGFHLSKPLITR